jgi:hypothetical protein
VHGETLARDLGFFAACFAGGLALGLFAAPLWLRILGALVLVLAYVWYVQRTLVHGGTVQAEETIKPRGLGDDHQPPARPDPRDPHRHPVELGGRLRPDRLDARKRSSPTRTLVSRTRATSGWRSSRRYTTYPVVEDGRALGLLAFRCVAAVWCSTAIGSSAFSRSTI